MDDGVLNEICAAAQHMWLNTYGCAPASGAARSPRLDKGRNKPKAQHSEAAWIARRRAATKAAANALGPDVDLAIRSHSETWTAKHDRELNFVKQKHIRNLAEAVQHDTILPEDVSGADLMAVENYLTKKEKSNHR